MQSKNLGVTLIELLIAISISFFVVITIIVLYIGSMKIFGTELNISNLQIESKRAMNLMSNEIKDCLEVESASPASFSFWWKDLNSNSSKEASEIVSYSWDGLTQGNLTRTISGSSEIISKYVDNFNLIYNSQVIALIRTVKITLTNSINNKISTLESTAKIRNL